jgi:cytochrome c peroxidase
MEIKKCVTCHNEEAINNTKPNNFKLIAYGLCKECRKKNKDSAQANVPAIILNCKQSYLTVI